VERLTRLRIDYLLRCGAERAEVTVEQVLRELRQDRL
jgi:hypothetical protein